MSFLAEPTDVNYGGSVHVGAVSVPLFTLLNP